MLAQQGGRGDAEQHPRDAGRVRLLQPRRTGRSGRHGKRAQRSEVNSTHSRWTAKRNATGSCTYFLRWPVKRPLIVKHCALPTTLALSLPRDASESVWWKIQTANKCLLPSMAQIHLKQKLAPWASFVLSEPRIFEGDVICLILSGNGMM